MPLPPSLDAKLQALRQTLAEAPYPALALSGGLDSSLLAHVAHACRPGSPPLLLHFRGPHVPESDTARARAFAQSRDLALHILNLDPLKLEDVRRNGPERCYHCKRALFAALAAALADTAGKDEGFASADRTGPPMMICDGTNASDLGHYRPGLRALREAGVRSPLAEAGIRRDEVEALAEALGLEEPRRAARPCLITRFAYGLAPTAEALRALGRAETALAAILGPEADFRLRLFAADAPLPHGFLPFAAELHLQTELTDEGATVLRLVIQSHGLYRRAVKKLEKYDPAPAARPCSPGRSAAKTAS